MPDGLAGAVAAYSLTPEVETNQLSVWQASRFLASTPAPLGPTPRARNDRGVTAAATELAGDGVFDGVDADAGHEDVDFSAAAKLGAGEEDGGRAGGDAKAERVRH